MNRAWLWCLLANVIGGSTFAAMDRAAESGLPVVTFTFFRCVLSTALFMALAAARKELAPKYGARDFGLLLLVAIPGFTLPLVLGVRGVALSTPGVGSILALMEPIAIVPLSFLFLGERPSGKRLIGIAIGLVGALFVVLGDELPSGDVAGPERRLGNILLAIQGAMWAVYTVAAKPLVGRHSALSVSCWSTAIGCLVLGLVAPLEWAHLRPDSLDPLARVLGLQDGVPPGMTVQESMKLAAPWAIYLGVFGSFLSVLFWNAGLKGVTATGMAVFIFVQPAVGLLLNVWLGKESPDLAVWTGFGLILAAVLLVTHERPDERDRVANELKSDA